MNKKYKIAMIGNIGTLSYGQITDETHIRDAFLELGHEVFCNDESEQTLKNVDFILTFKSNRVGINNIKSWKEKTDAPVFIWTFDNMNRFGWFYDIAKECDVWLGEELGRREWFKQQDLPFYYFPFHADNPVYFNKEEDNEKIYDVVFTGTPYQDDENSKFGILKAVDEKFNLYIFGNNEGGWKSQGFKNVHPPMFDSNLSELISQSKIVIAINNTRLEGYWSIRATQIMLCGGFCLQRYSPQMEKELRTGVVYWQEKEDLLEKIDYYLKNDTERQLIADKGFTIAHTCHTSIQRCSELITLFDNYNTLYDSIY